MVVTRVIMWALEKATLIVLPVVVGHDSDGDGLLSKRVVEVVVSAAGVVGLGSRVLASALGLGIAVVILGLIRILVLSSQRIVNGPVHSKLLVASLAAVPCALSAVDKLLLGQQHLEVVEDKICAFDGAGGAESPARTAVVALVLDRRDHALVNPIKGGLEGLVVRFLVDNDVALAFGAQKLSELGLGPVGHVVEAKGVSLGWIRVVSLDLGQVGLEHALSELELLPSGVADAILGEVLQVLFLAGRDQSEENSGC